MIVYEVFSYNEAGQGEKEAKYSEATHPHLNIEQQAIVCAEVLAEELEPTEYYSVVVYKCEIDANNGKQTDCETVYEILL